MVKSNTPSVFHPNPFLPDMAPYLKPVIEKFDLEEEDEEEDEE
jgi:hypothetical protein